MLNIKKLTFLLTIFILTNVPHILLSLAPSYNETFTVDELTPEKSSDSKIKTSTFQKKDLYTIEYQYKMTPYSTMANVLQQLDTLKIKFKLEISFSLGSIHQSKYKNLSLNPDVNNHGSFFALRIRKEQGLSMELAKEFTRKIAMLSSGLISLAAEDVIILRNWTENEDEYVFFNSLPNEILCFNHLQILHRLVRIEPQGIYDAFFGLKILDESYSSLLFIMDYSKPGEFDLKLKLSYLGQRLLTKSIQKQLIKPAYPYTTMKFRKWINMKEAEIAETRYQHDEEMTTFKNLRAKLRAKAKTSRVKNQEYKVMTFMTGPRQKIFKRYNCAILIDLDEENKGKDLLVHTPISFNYEQRPWISTLRIKILNSSGEEIAKLPILPETYSIRKFNENKKVNPHDNMTFEIRFTIPKAYLTEKIEVIISIDVGIMFPNYEQRRHEIERGAYLPPVVILTKFKGQRDMESKLLKIETLMIDTKRMDHTFMYPVLTMAFVMFTLLYTGLSYWGMVDLYPIIK